MAEEDQNQGFEQESGSGRRKLLLWLGLCVVIVAVATAAGFGVGQFVGPTPRKAAADTEQEPKQSSDRPEYRYYDLEAIIANFDDPRLARHVSVTVTLAIDRKDYNEATRLVSDRMPELRDWLTSYLAGHELDDLRGPRNLNRMRRDIEDAFNQKLWPDSSPRIRNVLFKEFFVQ